MYALAINGSARKGGNTELLLNHVLKPLRDEGWETEFIQIGGKRISGCIGCYKCVEIKDMRCSMKDDMFNDVMAKMVKADALILGSPTYFTDVTADMKALLDRSGFVAKANGGAFRGKVGAAVIAVRRAGSLHVFDTINHMFHLSQMIVPGSTYWNMGFGLNKGDVNNDEEGLRNMNHLGRMIVWLGKALQPHLDTMPTA